VQGGESSERVKSEEKRHEKPSVVSIEVMIEGERRDEGAESSGVV
jgi:hypothetical protein